MIDPSWLEDASREELEAYLDFWKELSPIERRIFVYSDILHSGSGQIGKIFGASDVEDHWIGMCGCDKPIYWPNSKTIEKKLKEIELKLGREINERGLNLGAIELEKSRYVFSIRTAFKGLVLDILFHDKGEHRIGYPSSSRLEEHGKEEKYRMQQAALLYLDVPRLDESAKKWLDKNRPTSSYETA